MPKTVAAQKYHHSQTKMNLTFSKQNILIYSAAYATPTPSVVPALKGYSIFRPQKSCKRVMKLIKKNIVIIGISIKNFD